MSRQLVAIFMMFSSLSFAQDRELASVRESAFRIDKTYSKPDATMKNELLALENQLKAIIQSRETQNPTPEQFDLEVDAQTLFATWEPVFELNRHKDRKKCTTQIGALEFEGTMGFEEGQVRPDYAIAIKLLKKICL